MYISSLGEFWVLPGHELLFGIRCVESEWLIGGLLGAGFCSWYLGGGQSPLGGMALGKSEVCPRDE